jgi:cleavage and polyadenylation specificity factor subunit 1
MIIDLKELGLQNIKDYCFLYGYYEPTLLILHETEKTCSSRIILKHNTCTVTAISLDVVRGHYPVIWTVKNLPNECYQLIPLPDPFGGALILSFDSILHVNQRLTYGMSFNDFIQYSESNLPITLDKSEETIVLDATAHTFLSKERILLSIGNDLWILNLLIENKILNKMTLKKVSKQIETSCVRNLFFPNFTRCVYSPIRSYFLVPF